MNKLDGFEELIKEKLEPFEVSYDGSSWAAMDQKLTQAYHKANTLKKTGRAGIVLAGITLIAGGIYFANSHHFFAPPQDRSDVSFTTPPAPVKNSATAALYYPADASVKKAMEQDSSLPLPAQVNVPTSNLGNDSGHTIQTHPQKSVNSHRDQLVQPNTSPVSNVSTVAPVPSEIREPSAQFSLSQHEGCAGSVIAFRPERIDDKVNYLWNFGDGTTATGITITHAYTTAGNYTVTLTASRAGKTRTAHSEVHIFEVPVADASWKMTEDRLIPEMRFTNLSRRAQNYFWTFDDGAVSTKREPSKVFTRVGLHKVSLTVTGDMGCSNTKVFRVPVKRTLNLLAPTSFTPESNIQLNQSWIPRAFEAFDTRFTVTVMDQNSGKKVFESSNANEKWDGRDKDGYIRYGSSYIWTCTFVNKYQEEETQQGYFVIVR